MGWSWERFRRCKINVAFGFHRGLAFQSVNNIEMCPPRVVAKVSQRLRAPPRSRSRVQQRYFCKHRGCVYSKQERSGAFPTKHVSVLVSGFFFSLAILALRLVPAALLPSNNSRVCRTDQTLSATRKILTVPPSPFTTFSSVDGPCASPRTHLAATGRFEEKQSDLCHRHLSKIFSGQCCVISLRERFLCFPPTKAPPRLSRSETPEAAGDKLDFVRKNCVTLPRLFSRPPSKRSRQ